MAVESLTNPRENLPNVYTDITVREIDFTSRFGRNIQALMDILGIIRPIKKENGTRLVSYVTDVTLASGTVAPGCVIPYSKYSITENMCGDVTVEKYAKAVPIEDVKTYGADVAIQKSDDAFLTKLQNLVTGRFYDHLLDDTSALTETYATWQMAVSMAIGLVKDKFQAIERDVSEVVVFANTLDAYSYLGAAGISTQTLQGLEYVKNFLGARTLILSHKIPRGKVVAVPVENIDLYYVDPADSDYAKLGLVYTTDGDTNFIGFHAQGNYSTAVGETYALLGMTLWNEIADGIAITKVGA